MRKSPFIQLFSRLAKLSLPVHPPTEEGPLLWRERIMFAIYFTAIVVGSVSLVSSASLARRNGHLFLVVSYVVAYACTIVITFVRRIPFRVRAWCGLAMFYALGLLALLTGGPIGSGRLWFFSLSIVATIFLGQNVGLLALGLSASTLLLLGLLMSQQLLAWPMIDFSLRIWTVGSLTFVFLNTIVTVSTAVLLRRLEGGLEKEQKLVTELEKSNEQLRSEMRERKRAEEKLKENEHKYHALIDLIGDCVYEFDRNLAYTYMSPKVRDVSGYEPEDYLGKTPFDFMPADEVERLAEFVHQGVESRIEIAHLENIAFHRDGSLVVQETSAVPIFDTGGEFSGYLCIDRNVTERKKAEEALRKSEEKYRTLFEESKDAVYVTTPEGEIADMNPAGVELLGYVSKEELLKANVARDTYQTPRDREAFQKMIEKQGFVKDYELILRRKDGKQVTVLVTCNAVRDDKGTIVAYRGIMRDVTKRRQLEFQLRQSSKLAAVGELAAGVAHEINNPIAAIDVQTGLMRDIVEEERKNLGTGFVKRIERYFDVVEGQVQRCQSVTRSLLSFTRTPNQNQDAIDLNALLRETLALVMSLSDKNPRIEMVLNERLPLLQCDSNQLQQAFINLLSNAFKAIDAGGSITVATRLEDDGSVSIEFKDSGSGIPSEIQERIFDPFFTTRPEGEGTGLGLSITHYIVKQMDGRIDVESSPGQGSRFTVTLPVSDRMIGGVNLDSRTG